MGWCRVQKPCNPGNTKKKYKTPPSQVGARKSSRTKKKPNYENGPSLASFYINDFLYKKHSEHNLGRVILLFYCNSYVRVFQVFFVLCTTLRRSQLKISKKPSKESKLTLCQGETPTSFSRKHPSRDVIFPAKECQKLSHHMMSLSL